MPATGTHRDPVMPAGYGVRRAALADGHHWARGRELGALALHASEDGRPLYETLGYLPTNEMRIDFLAPLPNVSPSPRSASG